MMVAMNVQSSFSSCPGKSLCWSWGVTFCSTGGKYWKSQYFVDESYSSCLSGPISILSNLASGTTGKMSLGN